MNIREDGELKEIYGGTTITGAIVNSFVDLIKILYDAGKSAGGAIRRIVDKNLCPLE